MVTAYHLWGRLGVDVGWERWVGKMLSVEKCHGLSIIGTNQCFFLLTTVHWHSQSYMYHWATALPGMEWNRLFWSRMTSPRRNIPLLTRAKRFRDQPKQHKSLWSNDYFSVTYGPDETPSLATLIDFTYNDSPSI